MRLIPASNREDARPNVFRGLREFNQCHAPAGSAKGGQFAAKGECGAGEGLFVPPVQKPWHEDSPVTRAAHEVLAKGGSRTEAVDAAERGILERAETDEERTYSRLLAEHEVKLMERMVQPDTLTKHSPDGGKTWTPERQRLHDAIMARPDINNPTAVSHPVGGATKPTLVIMMGLTASGKTTATGTDLAEFQKRAVTINNDEIKKHLPEYEGWNAGEVHEESSALGKEQLRAAVAGRKDILLDITGRNEKQVAKYVKMVEGDYHVTLVLVKVTQPQSVANSILRFVGEYRRQQAGDPKAKPRFVPDRVVKTAHVPAKGRTDAELAFEAMKGKVNAYIKVDNGPAVEARRQAARTGTKTAKGLRIAAPVLDQHGRLFASG